MWEFTQEEDPAMTREEQVKQLKAALKNSQTAVRAERRGRLAAENGKAAAEKKLGAALAKVEKLGNRVADVTGELKKETKAKSTAEKERDNALKKVEELSKSAETAESEKSDVQTRIMYLDRQVQALTALSNGYGLRHTDHDRMWDHGKELDRIIDDPKRLKSITGCTPGQFAFLRELFESYIKSAPDMPLFRGDARHAGKPGNRCKLFPRHALLLAAMRIYTGAGEDSMQPWFGIDQSNVSRYLDLGYRILGEVTATADFMTSLLKECKTVDDIREIIPHLRILVDGTHIERVRPGGSAARRAAYSGKKKQFTFNVQVITDHTGMPLNLSDVVDGSTHDYTVFKEHAANKGSWLLDLAAICKEHDEELEVVEDLGYLGMEKDYGSVFRVVQNVKRLRKDSPGYEPKYGGLSEEDRKRNKRVSKIRIFVEHGMAKIKRFKLVWGPFVGTGEDLRRVLNVVTGLANTNHLWDHIKDAPSEMLAKLTGMIKAGLAARTVHT